MYNAATINNATTIIITSRYRLSYTSYNNHGSMKKFTNLLQIHAYMRCLVLLLACVRAYFFWLLIPPANISCYLTINNNNLLTIF